MTETPVVTAFVERSDGRVLVLRRSATTTTYAGLWAGVSGYLEGDDPLAQAYEELDEETGLRETDVELTASGPPLRVTDDEGDWLVHPFVFRTEAGDRVTLNEESETSDWVEPATLAELETVPGLADAYVQGKLGDVVRLIVDDRSHGASWLAARAVEALAEAAGYGIVPLALGRALASARPSMGAIAGAVGRVLASARNPEQVVEEATALVAARERAARSITVLLQDDVHGTVMTHSASATVREALLHSRPERVVCTVSEPVGEGRTFSEDLAAEGLTVELVADEDAAHAVETVDLLLLGADTVFRDGSLVNKIGTRKLAEAAKKANVPVIVVCEIFKLAPFDPYEPDEEERFDITPPESIDRFVTDEGAFDPDEVPALLDRTPFLREGYALLAGEPTARQ
jgi:translation initiation factor 2B subunit (eIF-2B alpha/beta/delta family)/8-oxo-dGTP pyrophosphatase MutT (NUDIX family)